MFIFIFYMITYYEYILKFVTCKKFYDYFEEIEDLFLFCTDFSHY